MPARIPQAPSGRRVTRAAGPEDIVHDAVLDFLRAVLPAGAARNLHHARNEGASASERRRSARLGTKPGWPDLEWFGRHDDGTPYAAMIEVKAKGRGPTDEQTACHDGLADAGVLIGVARSIDDVRLLLRRWGVPTREVFSGVDIAGQPVSVVRSAA